MTLDTYRGGIGILVAFSYPTQFQSSMTLKLALQLHISSGFFLTFFQKLSLTKTRQISKLSQLFPQNSEFWLQNSFFR